MNDIRIVREPPLAWVTLDRPHKRNAMTAAMWQETLRLAQELDAAADVRVVLLAGAGNQAFSAGADIAEMEAALAQPEALAVMQSVVQDAQAAWAGIRQPTIAVIDGACTGGGCGLALACDVRIATPSSFFAIPPARLGLVYSLADTLRLVDLVGPAVAKEILFTGRRVTATLALELGLINSLVAAPEIEAFARALAAEIATSAPSSVQAAKRIVNEISRGHRQETAATRRLYDESFTSADFREGAEAFRTKRSPRF